MLSQRSQNDGEAAPDKPRTGGPAAVNACRENCQGACKPGSVPPTVSAWVIDRGGPYRRRQPFIWAARCRAARAANPDPLGRSALLLRLATGSAGSLFGLAPGGVYHAGAVAGSPGALLPHPFSLACAALPKGVSAIGGLLSVALSLDFAPGGARRAGVTRHPYFVEPGLSSNLSARGCPAPWRPGT